MVSLIGNKIIKNPDAPESRGRWGTLCGAAGIVLNLFLCGAKLFAGTVSGSIAVTADALNNLSDAGSSVISLVGFRLAEKKPDKDHPFGHGRTEYISGLIIALLIMLVGFELGKSSVEKIFHPEAVDFSLVAVIILALSICVKVYMFAYNTRIGKRIHSETLLATAKDSLSDCISTGATLISLLVLRFTGFSVDAYVGTAVALFILKAGFDAARDTVSPLMGKAPDPEDVKHAEELVLSCEGILGIHDLVFHDYGPGRLIISLHAEVDEEVPVNVSHERIDYAERLLAREMNCSACIHMDPISLHDPELESLKKALREAAVALHPDCKIHDLRLVRGPSHSNVIFDAVVPFEVKRPEAELLDYFANAVKALNSAYAAVVNIDRPYA